MGFKWGAFVAALLSASCCQEAFGAGAYLAVPAARNIVHEGAYKSPLQIGTFNGGGPAAERINSHSVCGDANVVPLTPSSVYNLLEQGVWAPTPIQAVYDAGQTIDITVVVEEHRHGHFEFRLCYPSDGGVSNDINTRQECLDKEILKIDPADRTAYAGQMRPGIGSPFDIDGDSREVSADQVAGRCSSLPDAPVGSCCKSEKEGIISKQCSSERENEHRWALPKPNNNGPKGASQYRLKFQLPEGKSCERCVLQMYYEMGQTPEKTQETALYPEGVWNCADIRINGVPEEESSNGGAIAGGVIGGLAACATLGFVFKTVRNKQAMRSSMNDSHLSITLPSNIKKLNQETNQHQTLTREQAQNPGLQYGTPNHDHTTNNGAGYNARGDSYMSNQSAESTPAGIWEVKAGQGGGFMKKKMQGMQHMVGRTSAKFGSMFSTSSSHSSGMSSVPPPPPPPVAPTGGFSSGFAQPEPQSVNASGPPVPPPPSQMSEQRFRTGSADSLDV